jgi:hypothetical protein
MKLLAVVGRVSLAIALIALISLGLLHPAWAAPQFQGQDIAQITSPTEGQAISGLVTISGSADHPEFGRWELAYDAWQPFAEGAQPVLNGTIGTWNTGVIADGGYMLRLRVIRKDSNYSEAFIRGLQVSNSAPIGTPTSIPPAATFPAEQPTFSSAEAAQPIATVMVEQPPTSVPEARTAQTTQPQANAASRRNTTSTSGSFDAKQLGSACLNGVLIIVGMFALLAAIQMGRWGVKEFRRSQKRKQ